MPDITTEKLDELERLLAQATPGPCRVCDLPDGAALVEQCNEEGLRGLFTADCSMTDEGPANAALYAALHTVAPALIAAARKGLQAEGEIKRIKRRMGEQARLYAERVCRLEARIARLSTPPGDQP